VTESYLPLNDGEAYLQREIDDRDAKANLANDASAMDDVICWHRRIGHLNVRELLKCYEDKSVRGIDLKRIAFELEKCGTKKTVADMYVYVKGSGESFMIGTIFVDDCVKRCEVD